MSQPIQDSLQKIKQAQVEVNKNLSDTDYRGNLLEINSLFQRLIARHVFMGAIENPDDKPQDRKLQPMTRFMGRDVKQDKTSDADLDPNEHMKQQYLQKVNKLYGSIQFTAPSIILNAYTMTDDVMVLRGVAKKAGVEGYETKELNQDFIEEIQFNIAAKIEEAQLQKNIDEKSKAKGNEVTVTQDMIESSKFLQKEKVKPGDKVLQLTDGKYKLLQPA